MDETKYKLKSNFIIYAAILIIITFISTFIFLISSFSNFNSDTTIVAYFINLFMFYIIQPIFGISVIYNLIKKRYRIYPMYFISFVICAFLITSEFIILNQLVQI